jgi:hypothetical protein
MDRITLKSGKQDQSEAERSNGSEVRFFPTEE